MAEFQVTYWREIPSMVVARDSSGGTSKVALPDRFQEAIDEAAMRAGAAGSDAYLADWRRADWEERSGDPAVVAAAVAGELDDAFPADRLAELIGEES